MGEIVVSNAFLLERIAATRTDLNVGHWLYLFTNDFTPTEADTLSAFVEAGFPGYAPLPLAGLFSDPIKSRDGEYVSAIPLQSWTCTGAANEWVYGWYVRKGGTVQMSLVLDAPILVNSGVVVEVQIHYITRSLTLVE
jgi:hypothetical protein